MVHGYQFQIKRVGGGVVSVVDVAGNFVADLIAEIEGENWPVGEPSRVRGGGGRNSLSATSQLKVKRRKIKGKMGYQLTVDS